MIIPPQSSLLGERLLQTGLKRDPDIHIIAIKRTGLHYTEKKIHDIRLRIGDILLVRSPLDKLEQVRTGSDFIIVEDVHHEIIHKRKAPLVLMIFGGIVAAASLGLADIMVCALAGLFLMILFGCLQLRDAYRALQGNILLLIVGAIALGAAMQKTGTSQLYAETFLSLFSGLPARVVLGGIMLLTSLVTHLLSNNATGVLLLPIAVSTALTLGVDPKPFIIGVCLGASACFASPMGYQTNLLVYGPGSYRFADYLKLGIPLNLIVIGMGLILIPIFWPF
jgi:di/tricarboxylate transporter